MKPVYFSSPGAECSGSGCGGIQARINDHGQLCVGFISEGDYICLTEGPALDFWSHMINIMAQRVLEDKPSG